jgi:hypothetical protein
VKTSSSGFEHTSVWAAKAVRQHSEVRSARIRSNYSRPDFPHARFKHLLTDHRREQEDVRLVGIGVGRKQRELVQTAPDDVEVGNSRSDKDRTTVSRPEGPQPRKVAIDRNEREVNLTPALKSRPNKVIAKAGVRPFVLREHRFTRSMEMTNGLRNQIPVLASALIVGGNRYGASEEREPDREGESPPPVHKHAALGETDADKYDHKDPSHRVIAGIGPVMPEVQHKLCPDRSANRADKHCASAGGGHRHACTNSKQDEEEGPQERQWFSFACTDCKKLPA